MGGLFRVTVLKTCRICVILFPIMKFWGPPKGGGGQSHDLEDPLDPPQVRIQLPYLRLKLTEVILQYSHPCLHWHRLFAPCLWGTSVGFRGRGVQSLPPGNRRPSFWGILVVTMVTDLWGSYPDHLHRKISSGSRTARPRPLGADPGRRGCIIRLCDAGKKPWDGLGRGGGILESKCRDVRR